MKTIAIAIMLAALFLLYRVAYPKQPKTKSGNDIPQKKEIDVSEVVVKSRFVRPKIGQPQPTHTTTQKNDFQEEIPITFAAGNENRNAVIPPEKLNEVFAEEVNPDDLEIDPDEDEEPTNVADLEEEAEDLRETLSNDAELATGMSIEEMTEAAQAIDNPTDEKANVLFQVEKTDMFEKLVSGDDGKAATITAIIERHVQSLLSEVENENDDNSDIDVSEFLGLTNKK
jgi:hypothetical protein